MNNVRCAPIAIQAELPESVLNYKISSGKEQRRPNDDSYEFLQT